MGHGVSLSILAARIPLDACMVPHSKNIDTNSSSFSCLKIEIDLRTRGREVPRLPRKTKPSLQLNYSVSLLLFLVQLLANLSLDGHLI